MVYLGHQQSKFDEQFHFDGPKGCQNRISHHIFLQPVKVAAGHLMHKIFDLRKVSIDVCNATTQPYEKHEKTTMKAVFGMNLKFFHSNSS